MDKFNKTAHSSYQLIKWRVLMDIFKNEAFTYFFFVFACVYILMTFIRTIAITNLHHILLRNFHLRKIFRKIAWLRILMRMRRVFRYGFDKIFTIFQKLQLNIFLNYYNGTIFFPSSLRDKIPLFC